MSYGNGGGASHIALSTGLLDSFSDASDLLLVAGGGGGGNLTDTTPGNGGGFQGGNPKYNGTAVANKSGTQSTGYAFGKGESAPNAPGGGSGFYGGLAGEATVSGAGSGSGYIGNELLTGDKYMVGYDVLPSTDDETKTRSKQSHSSIALADKAKLGNGYVRITYAKAPTPLPPELFFEADFNKEGKDKVHYGNNNVLMGEYYSQYDYITRTAKQGELINFFENGVWSIEDGALSVVGDGYIEQLFVWGYDTDVVNQHFFPATCTIVLEMEALFETNDYAVIEFHTYAPGEASSDKPEMLVDTDSAELEIPYDSDFFSIQTWHNMRIELLVADGYWYGYESYLDNVEKDFISNSNGYWPCIDGENLIKCHGIGLEIAGSVKIRKLKISYTV